MDNIEYIKTWFMTHNLFLKEEPYRDEKLSILIFYAVAFEKLANLNNADQIVQENGMFRFVAGPAVSNEKTEQILNVINVKYGYLNLQKLKKTPGYFYIHRGLEEDGIVEDEILRDYLEDIFVRAMNYYKNYNFDKYVYKVKEKVFFSVNPLTEDEIAQLSDVNDRDQTLYEINHDEYGMYIW